MSSITVDPDTGEMTFKGQDESEGHTLPTLDIFNMFGVDDQSFLKVLTGAGAKNPIRIDNYLDVFNHMIDGVSRYVGHAEYAKWAKETFGNPAISEALFRKHGKNRALRIQQGLMRDINSLGGTYNPDDIKFFDKMISRLKASFMSNPEQAVAQLSGLAFFRGYYDGDVFGTGLEAPIDDDLVARILIHAPMIRLRMRNPMHAIVSDNRRAGGMGIEQYGKTRIMTKVARVAQNNLQKADSWTIKKAVAMAKAHVDKYQLAKPGDENYDQVVANILSDSVASTQASTSMMDRPYMLLRHDMLSGIFGFLKGEAFKTFSQLQIAIDDWLDAKKNGTPEQRTEAAQKMMAMGLTLLMSQGSYIVIKTVSRAMLAGAGAGAAVAMGGNDDPRDLDEVAREATFKMMNQIVEQMIGTAPYTDVILPPIRAVRGILNDKGYDKYTMRRIGLTYPLETIVWDAWDSATGMVKYNKSINRARTGVGLEGKRYTHAERRRLEYNAQKAARAALVSGIRFGGEISGLPGSSVGSVVSAFMKRFEEVEK
jgi:hypothetical protein